MKNKCIGCGICVNICPQGIEVVRGKARIKDENAKCLKDATDTCPREVILFDKDDGQEEKVGEIERTKFGPGQVGGLTSGMGQGFGRNR